MSRMWLNTLMKYAMKKRMHRMHYVAQHPHEVQNALLSQLVNAARETQWGKIHNFKKIYTPVDFAQKVPVQDYETLKPYIERMMHGERDVLSAGAVNWFSKSSGTTNDKSKFIPVTVSNLKTCHLKGAWDTSALIFNSRPNNTCYGGKFLFMGGAHQPYEAYPKTHIGDVSAIMIHHQPSVANYIYAPSLDIAMMQNFEEKIERMAYALIKEDMRCLAGVPTWTVVLLRRILEISRKDCITDVWPNLQLYIHGGVSFLPYKNTFSELIPKKDFIYWDIYNASEGFFATQAHDKGDDMLLLLQNGVYFEFLPESEWYAAVPKAVTLKDVEVGKNYAPVITTNAGLWRYVPGDTVLFTNIYPYKIKITGRIKQFVNAFGEEVMVSNTDKALAETCDLFDARVREYTVAPIYFDANAKGGHEWLIEFERPPQDIEAFNKHLDNSLQKINSDYEAKRFRNMAMVLPKLRAVPNGTFHNWLKSKGRFGGQNKVPRLANHRQYLEDILRFA